MVVPLSQYQGSGAKPRGTSAFSANLKIGETGWEETDWSSGGNRNPTSAGGRETCLAGCVTFPSPEQGRWLSQVLRGYLAYHAVPTNSQAITSFVHYVTWHWNRALGRRSQKGHVNWTRMAPVTARWLPPASVQHPYPQQRFIVKHPRWEPSALTAHARICPGGAG